MKKIFKYVDLRKKYNTLKIDYDMLLDTHEKDVNDKTKMRHEINRLKNKIKVLKSSNKEKSKKKSSSKTKSKSKSSKSTKKTN